MMSESLVHVRSADSSIEMEVFNGADYRRNGVDNKINKRFVVSLDNEQLSDEEIVMRQWVHEYTANVDKINQFYLTQLQNLINRIEELKEVIQSVEVHFNYI